MNDILNLEKKTSNMIREVREHNRITTYYDDVPCIQCDGEGVEFDWPEPHTCRRCYGEKVEWDSEEFGR